jgi:hypothetical protein
VGHHNRSAAALDNMIERTYGPVDPEGITYFSLFDHIVIETDEDDLVVEISVL